MLVEPPFFRLHHKDYALELYPLALGYLAESVLQRTMWKVQAFNADFSPFPRIISTSHLAGEGYREYRRNLADTTGPVWQEVRAAIADFRPSVLGISAKTQNFASARIVARIAKSRLRCGPWSTTA